MGRMGGIAEENNDEANAAQLKSSTIFIQYTLWTFMCICQTAVQCGSWTSASSTCFAGLEYNREIKYLVAIILDHCSAGHFRSASRQTFSWNFHEFRILSEHSQCCGAGLRSWPFFGGTQGSNPGSAPNMFHFPGRSYLGALAIFSNRTCRSFGMAGVSCPAPKPCCEAFILKAHTKAPAIFSQLHFIFVL